MTKVFIGGSRRVSHLSVEVCRRLDNIVESGFPVVVGDANGVDKAAQEYMYAKGYQKVEVFCSGAHCRNNVGRWTTRSVPTEDSHAGFRFYSTKDRAMALEASVGFMIWDGKSAGTLLNVLRLLNLGKKVAVYEVPARRFWELRKQEQWRGFVLGRAQGLIRKVEREAAIDRSRQRQLLAPALWAQDDIKAP